MDWISQYIVWISVCTTLIIFRKSEVDILECRYNTVRQNTMSNTSKQWLTSTDQTLDSIRAPFTNID